MTSVTPLLEAGEIAAVVRPERAFEDLWTLVTVPSPTGREREAAELFRNLLAEAGAEAELDEALPESPSVIGRLRGDRPGPTFQLAGHLDHIDVPHGPPTREGETITGRGAADMKNGLAGMLEVVRAFAAMSGRFPGELLVTAYGLHEAPRGDAAPLLGLIERGITGDAAMVFESAGDAEGAIAVAGKGQSVWTVTLERRGSACHELQRPAEADGVLDAAIAVARRLRQHACELESRGRSHPLLGRESLFIGRLDYGDFYNRAPQRGTLQGTRRWLPGQCFTQMKSELGALLDAVTLPAGVNLRRDWLFVGEAYALDPHEPAVDSLRRATHRVTGAAPPDVGAMAVIDGHRLAGVGGVPTVLLGFGHATAHADEERVTLSMLADPCRIATLTAWDYLHRCSAGDSHRQTAAEGRAS